VTNTERILAGLAFAGGQPVPRTVMYRICGGGITAQELDDILFDLRLRGVAVGERRAPRGGRPAETWRLASLGAPQ
jgi:hypothetical protein